MDGLDQQISLLIIIKQMYELIGDLSKVEEAEIMIQYLENKKNELNKQNIIKQFKFK
jgi:hypothetical protein